MWDRAEFRRIRVLASQLPAESRTVKRMDPRMTWDLTAYLLALAIDNISCLRYEQSGSKGKKPKPIPRPQPKKEKQRFDVSEGRVENLLFAPRNR